MRFYYTIILVFLCTAFVAAQPAVFKASTNAKQVVEGGIFDLSFTLENVEGNNFQSPSLRQFQRVSGPNNSSQMSVVNGRVSRKQSISYSLMAKKIGKYTIGPASIRANGKLIKTKPITIEVVKANKKSARNTGAGKTKEGDIFVRLELSDSTVYIGQQITAKYMLYTTKDINSADFLTESSYDGFYATRIRNYRDQAKVVVIDGVQYTTKTLKAIGLFPQQTGNYTIEKANINLGIPIKDNRRNSFFFSTRVQPYQTNTEEVAVRVLKTPPNAPSSFSGAIGKYAMNAVIDKKSITTDDALTITMSISGYGDGKFVQPPTLAQEHFDFYDPNVIEEQSIEQGDRLKVAKKFEYLVVPQKTGTFTIRPEFTYFDVDSNLYKTVYARAFRVNVVQGTGQNKELSIQKDAVKELLPIINTTKVRKKGRHFFGSAIHVGLLSLPLLSFFGLLFYKRKQIEKSNIDPALLKKSKAQQLAMERLEEASQAMKNAKPKEFYEYTNQGLFGYISDKYMIKPADLNRDHISSVLEKNGVSEPLRQKFTAIVNTCQRALYGGVSNEGMSEFYQEVVDWIVEMEA